MESIAQPLRINYTILTKVTGVEERFKREYVTGFGESALFNNVSQGWFVSFDGSNEALHFGDTKPHFEVGDRVKFTIEKIYD